MTWWCRGFQQRERVQALARVPGELPGEPERLLRRNETGAKADQKGGGGEIDSQGGVSRQLGESAERRWRRRPFLHGNRTSEGS